MVVKKTITKDNVNNIIEMIKELDFTKPWRMQLSEYKFNRTTDQNSRYWKLLRSIGDYIGYEEDEMDALMKYKFLSSEIEVGGETIIKVKSTSQLNTKEMVEYQENIQSWAMQYGFRFREDDE
ncbi:recombination protein NinB [Methylophilaceae bacterium]|nr:recombination protein NinB [Methylophilaceae bacterium]